MFFYLRRLLIASLLFFSVGISASVNAAEVDSIQWDGTARGTGEALTKSGLLDQHHMKICQVAAEAKLLDI